MCSEELKEKVQQIAANKREQMIRHVRKRQRKNETPSQAVRKGLRE